MYIQYRRDISAAYQRVSDGSNILMTGNGAIEYGIDGEGMPVLLVHGAGGGYDQGLLMGQAFLGSGYKFISVSRFGYLGSPFVDDSTVEKQALLYNNLLEHLDVDRAIILGVSAGGPSAVQFTHDYPERSSALILVSAVSKFMGDEIPMSTKIVNIIQKSDFVYWLVLKTFRTQFLELIGIPQETYSALDLHDKEFADKMLEYMHPMSKRSLGNIHEANIRPLSGDKMSGISIPTMILHAKDDILVTYEHAEYYSKNIEQSELVSFDSGGHGMATELKSIRNNINRFLKE
ncbi:MAG: alpha/beta hydrolase [Dethiosulfatibacter sp.]|nr:alpha/beta hydrolase [Dethiosulfatibacter sp.]